MTDRIPEKVRPDLQLQNAQQLHNIILWISSWEVQINPK